MITMTGWLWTALIAVSVSIPATIASQLSRRVQAVFWARVVLAALTVAGLAILAALVTA